MTYIDKLNISGTAYEISALSAKNSEKLGGQAPSYYATSAVSAAITAKQDKLTSAQMSAISSVSGHINDTVKHITSAERTNWNGKQAALSTAQLSAISSVSGHINDTVKHITSAERNTWNGKQDKLTSAQLSAISSVSGHINNSNIHVTSSDKSNWNSKATSADITSAINALDVNDSAVANQFVISVSETDGKISVSRAQPQISDVKDLQTALNNKADKSTVGDFRTKSQHISMGANLVVNGNGRNGDNYNFTSFKRYPTIVTNGAACSFGFNGSGREDEYMSCDFTKKILLSVDIKNLAVQPTTPTHRIYVEEYDIDKKAVQAVNVMYGVGTLTELTQDLKPGDTVVHLRDLSNNNWKSSTSYHRGFIFWNYKNSFGYQYEPETYSRNVYPTGDSAALWEVANVDQVNNTITLNSPWTGSLYPAGTKVSRRSSGGTYPYPASAQFNDLNWHHLVGTMNGVASVGTSERTNKFSQGVAYFRVGVLPSNLTVAPTTDDRRAVFANLSVYELPDVSKGINGTLPIANGGTGATTAPAARTNLDVYSKSEVSATYATKTSLNNASGSLSQAITNLGSSLGSQIGINAGNISRLDATKQDASAMSGYVPFSVPNNSIAWGGGSATDGSIAWIGGSATSESMAWYGGSASKGSIAIAATATNGSIAGFASSAASGSIAWYTGQANDCSIANDSSLATNKSVALNVSTAVSGSIALNNSTAIGGSLAFGHNGNAQSGSVSFLGGTSISGSLSFGETNAINGSISLINGIARDGSLNFGPNTMATDGSVALGYDVTAKDNSYAIGYEVTAEDRGFAVGIKGSNELDYSASDVYSKGKAIAIGLKTTASDGSVAVGQNVNAVSGSLALSRLDDSNAETFAGDGSISIGSRHDTFAQRGAVAIGGGTAYDGSFVIGNSYSNQGSIVAGGNSTAESASIVLGYGATALDSSISIGIKGDVYSSGFSVAIGRNVTASGGGVVLGSYSTALNGSFVFSNSNTTFATNGSIALIGSTAYNGSIAFTNSYATGGSFALGWENTASDGSISLGNGNTATNCSYAIGKLIDVSDWSLGIGIKGNSDVNLYSKNSSIAIGRDLTAQNNSITLGYNCIATGNSLSIGEYASAYDYSIATRNSYAASQTTALGNGLTGYNNEMVLGRYNAYKGNASAFVIGLGKSENDRRNGMVIGYAEGSDSDVGKIKVSADDFVYLDSYGHTRTVRHDNDIYATQYGTYTASGGMRVYSAVNAGLASTANCVCDYGNTAQPIYIGYAGTGVTKVAPGAGSTSAGTQYLIATFKDSSNVTHYKDVNVSVVTVNSAVSANNANNLGGTAAATIKTSAQNGQAAYNRISENNYICVTGSTNTTALKTTFVEPSSASRFVVKNGRTWLLTYDFAIYNPTSTTRSSCLVSIGTSTTTTADYVRCYFHSSGWHNFSITKAGCVNGTTNSATYRLYVSAPSTSYLIANIRTNGISV